MTKPITLSINSNNDFLLGCTINGTSITAAFNNDGELEGLVLDGADHNDSLYYEMEKNAKIAFKMVLKDMKTD